MRVLVFARPEILGALRRGLEKCGAEIVAEVSEPARILVCVRNSPADLLLLDPDFSLHATIGAAREGSELHGSQVAFFSPSDDIVGDVVLRLDPVALLPASFNEADLAGLLSKARARDEVGCSARRKRVAQRLARSRLELGALASMLLAVLVGYFLPDGLAIFQTAGHKSYYIVVGLGTISLACLLSVRRPILAGFHTGLIALVTILPTQ